MDKLTQEEALVASAELLKVTHNVDGRVQDVQGDVHDVGDRVQDVDNRVQGIGNDVNDISYEVREVTRSLSLTPTRSSEGSDTTQGISSEIDFYDGFRRQIHPSSITLPPKLITMVQPNGFFKATYSMNGNPQVHSCGYTESVCHSLPLHCVCRTPDHLSIM